MYGKRNLREPHTALYYLCRRNNVVSVRFIVCGLQTAIFVNEFSCAVYTVEFVNATSGENVQVRA